MDALHQFSLCLRIYRGVVQSSSFLPRAYSRIFQERPYGRRTPAPAAVSVGIHRGPIEISSELTRNATLELARVPGK